MPPQEGELGTTAFGSVRDRLSTLSPLAWILLTPLMTLPLSGVLLFTVAGAADPEALGLTEREWVSFGGRFDRVNYFYFDFWTTCALLMGPGLLNLAVALWLFHRLTYVRLAAAIALALALVRTFAVPLGALLLLSSVDVIGDAGLLIRVSIGESGLRNEDPSGQLATFEMLGRVWAGGLGMWLVTAAVLWAYEPLMARFRPDLAPPRERQAAQPGGWGGFLARR